MVDVRPFGSWPSPITPELLVAGASQPTDVWVEGGTVWWSETRPSEAGRIQLVRRDPDGTTTDLLDEGWNARTAVHEYGGGAWWVHHGIVFFTSWADQRLYRLDPDGEPRPITPEPAAPRALRYADGRCTDDGRFVVCVREVHDEGGVRNELVAFPADGSAPPRVLVSGPDFVAFPRISRDGRQLAWISWDQPDMPWDATELWVGHLDDDGAGLTLVGVRRVAGDTHREALLQPEWGRHGDLFAVTDRDEWWNVHRVAGDDDLVAVHRVPAEVGRPLWILGQSRYVVTRDGRVVSTFERDGSAVLAVTADDGATVEHVLDGWSSLAQLRVEGDRLTAIAASPTSEPVVVALSVADPTDWEVLRPPRDLGLDPAVIARPRRVSFPTTGGRTAHAWVYEPTNPAVTGPDGEHPPLLVTIHGGPTSAARPELAYATQFWTSRGFAVADVDYGGSTGYGRSFRRQLDGQWGVVDVDDCGAAARHLADTGVVDGTRMAIRGGSAGGFTTLLALTTGAFAAGTSYFGVTDLVLLMSDDHKFEQRYTDGLVGPWPEAAEAYRERSPINRVDEIDVPVLVLQGDEDQVVPKTQADALVAALAERGVPHEYQVYDGEQHGFRKAASIIDAFTRELAFYGRAFGFDPA
jgi:dipeptidyl aminopeptidase/acylaminoacyl peptidase